MRGHEVSGQKGMHITRPNPVTGPVENATQDATHTRSSLSLLGAAFMLFTYIILPNLQQPLNTCPILEYMYTLTISAICAIRVQSVH